MLCLVCACVHGSAPRCYSSAFFFAQDFCRCPLFERLILTIRYVPESIFSGQLLQKLISRNHHVPFFSSRESHENLRFKVEP